MVQPAATQPVVPAPTLANVAYGPHPKQVLNLWKAESDKPTPMFMCPSPIGIRVIDVPITFEVEFLDDKGAPRATGTINLGGALPDLTGQLTIDGSTAASVTVRRYSGGVYRVFFVAPCYLADTSSGTLRK